MNNIIKTIIVFMLAGAGAGFGTGVAGLSATVVSAAKTMNRMPGTGLILISAAMLIVKYIIGYKSLLTLFTAGCIIIL